MCSIVRPVVTAVKISFDLSRENAAVALVKKPYSWAGIPFFISSALSKKMMVLPVIV